MNWPKVLCATQTSALARSCLEAGKSAHTSMAFSSRGDLAQVVETASFQGLPGKCCDG